MSNDEFIMKLEAVLVDLRATRATSAMLISKDAIALMKRRIINKGKDENDKKIGDYSQAVVPVWMYKNKEKRVANAVEKLVKKKGYFASYRDWREVNNLPVEFKNFSFTGHMWSSVSPIIVEQDEASVTIGMAATTANGAKKLQFVIAKHPNILNLSKSETELISKTQTKRILAAMERHGLINGESGINTI